MRVLRNHVTLNDLLAIFPSLMKRSLAPSTLTGFERRLLLDLPDEKSELTNLHAATGLSREQLIQKANLAAADLIHEEVVLLNHRFWSPPSAEERRKIWSLLSDDDDDDASYDNLDAARAATHLPG